MPFLRDTRQLLAHTMPCANERRRSPSGATSPGHLKREGLRVLSAAQALLSHRLGEGCSRNSSQMEHVSAQSSWQQCWSCALLQPVVQLCNVDEVQRMQSARAAGFKNSALGGTRPAARSVKSSAVTCRGMPFPSAAVQASDTMLMKLQADEL